MIFGRLIVMARAPVLGQVKRRLAAAVGEDRALAVHRELLDTALAQASAVPSAMLELWWTGDQGVDELLVLAETRDLSPRRQSDGDLGQRMAHAMSSGESPVVLIGSDCPALDSAAIELAFECLEAADAVFVPVEDGGYALVGWRRPLPAIFDGLDWGESSVMRDTRDRLRALGASWCELPRLWDVDTADDLGRWRDWVDANR